MLYLPKIYFNTESQIQNARRVCYYTNWSQYRHGVGKFLPDKIDGSLCTHLIFAFAKLENNKLVNYEWNDVPPTWDTTKGGL